jgi:ring-1,2-phenylacetyl-CoA epoxidase subunit PaaE
MAFGFFKKSEKKSETPVNAGPHYYDLKVKNIIQETKDAISIVFEQPANKISYKSGQFLTLIAPVAGKEVRRAYSLNSSPFHRSGFVGNY